MMSVGDLIDDADRLLAEGEALVEATPKMGGAKLKEAVELLFKAFLTFHKQSTAGGLLELYQRCRELEPELEALEDAVEFLNSENIGDAEGLADAANEIWDLITDLFPEDLG